MRCTPIYSRLPSSGRSPYAQARITAVVHGCKDTYTPSVVGRYGRILGPVTSVYGNEITKKDVDSASENFSSMLDQIKKEWVSEGTKINQSVNSIYNRDIRSSFDKLQGDIVSAIRNNTDYIISRINPFLNQYEKNRNLLQCIDLRKTLSATDEAIEKAFSNVHSCKWNATLLIIYHLGFINTFPQVDNVKVTNLNDEFLKCSQNTGSTNYAEILRCVNKVKENALKVKEEIILYLKNQETSVTEKLTAGLRVINECKRHINLAEIRQALDDQFNKIEKCISDSQSESGTKNEITVADIHNVGNSGVLHIRERVERSIRSLTSTGKDPKWELAMKNLTMPERLRLIQSIEKNWQAHGHGNEALSTHLTSEQYSHLMECTMDGAACARGIALLAFGMAGYMEQQLLILAGYPNLREYVTQIIEEGKGCTENLNNIQKFHDATQCILRVDGQASIVFSNVIAGMQLLADVLLRELESYLNNPENCNVESSLPSEIDNVKSCFFRLYKKKGQEIFRS